MTEIPHPRFDDFNIGEIPDFILCNPNKEQLFSLGAISERKYLPRVNAISELSFRADKYVNEIEMEYYEYIEQRRLVYVADIGYFIIDEIKETDNGIEKYKEITCKSLEAELLSKKIVMYTSGNESFPVPVTINQLMIDVLEKYIPNWSYDIEQSASAPIFSNKYRSHDISDTNIYDFLINNVESAYGCIIDFDTNTNNIIIYDPSLYVEKSDIFFSHDNLINNININTITDQLSTCLYVKGGGDMGINYVNPLGNNYIYNFDYYKNTYWMGETLISELDDWQTDYYNLSPLYIEHVDTFFEWTDWISGCTSGCAWISSSMVYTKQAADAALEAGDEQLYEELMEAWESLNQNHEDIVNKIENGIVERAEVYDDMSDISEQLDFKNALSATSYNQLQPFIIQSSYINDNIIRLDNMSASSIQENQNQLFEQATQLLNKLSIPQYTFEIDGPNFMQIFEYDSTIINQIGLGVQTTIELDKDRYIYPLVLGMDINYDDPEDFKIIFGSRLRLDDESFQFSDIMNNALYSGNIMRLHYQDFKNWSTQYKDQVINFISSPISTEANVIYNNTAREIQMDSAGIIGKSMNLTDGTYSPCQIMISKNTISSTTDNWKTNTKLLGNIISASAFGLNSDALVGPISTNGISIDGNVEVRGGEIWLNSYPTANLYFGDDRTAYLYTTVGPAGYLHLSCSLHSVTGGLKLDDFVISSKSSTTVAIGNYTLIGASAISMLDNTGTLYFGASSDISLYRASGSLLRTPGNFETGGDIYINNAVPAIYFADGDGSYDTNLYRTGANMLKTDDKFVVAASSLLLINAGQPTIYFGSTSDVNLYRDSADILKTDDSLEVAGDIVSKASVSACRIFTNVYGGLDDETMSASIVPDSPYGIFIMQARSGYTDFSGMAMFRAVPAGSGGPWCIEIIGNSTFGVATVATGSPQSFTSYTDGSVVLVSSGSGALWIVNRRGGTINFAYTILGG